MEFKDYYKTLGVAKDASSDEIKRAFRSLARKYHPDVAADKRLAEEKFKEINEAYEVLGDPANRRKYDQLGASWKDGGNFRQQPGRDARFRQQAGHGTGAQDFDFEFEGTGFSDFFEQFFGGRSNPFSGFGSGEGARTWGRRAQAERGEDVRGDILITLEEVLNGTLRSITVRRINPRTGRDESETYQVRIPAGVREGQSVRLRGKGGEGSAGGGAGDLYLRVRYAQHPEFNVSGSDLVGSIELAPWEAVLGATVSIPTLEGTVSLKIPPGTQQGNRLRIRGRGLPAGNARRGDLYVQVSIQVPPSSGEEEKRLWKQLAARSMFSPR